MLEVQVENSKQNENSENNVFLVPPKANDFVSFSPSNLLKMRKKSINSENNSQVITLSESKSKNKLIQKEVILYINRYQYNRWKDGN